jgi:hypothetical protein
MRASAGSFELVYNVLQFFLSCSGRKGRKRGQDSNINLFDVNKMLPETKHRYTYHIVFVVGECSDSRERVVG